MEYAIPNSDHQLILIVIKAGTTTDSEYDMAPTDILDLNIMSHLALTYPAFLTFLTHPIKQRGLLVLIIFQEQTTFSRTFVQIPGHMAHFSNSMGFSMTNVKFKDFSRSIQTCL